MKKHVKAILAPIILVVTATVFIWYLHGHPEVIRQLKHINPALLAMLVLLYCVTFAAIVAQLQISVLMYKKRMGIQENFLLSAYSSLANFFGPGQSGPGVRGVYLKKRHNMRVKDYVFATLLYYACYAVISACLMLGGVRPWWQTAGFVLAAAVCSALVIRLYTKRSKLNESRASILRFGGWMFVATLAQLLVQVVIYSLELHAAGSHASLGQAVSYTGAANFALFAALTPGAIGIREAFLVFTHNLHHIGNNTIVAANIIDRAAYLVFLGILFVIVFGLHANRRLKLHQLAQESETRE
jgi:uncharacterized membrane protein YbhN (UPF0104 family)